jgi:hypothetical protein
MQLLKRLGMSQPAGSKGVIAKATSDVPNGHNMDDFDWCENLGRGSSFDFSPPLKTQRSIDCIGEFEVWRG